MVYAIIGAVILAASFLFSMLGLGGGMVYVPLLHWAGFDLKTVAIPVGLLLNGVTTSLALITYSKKKLVDWSGGWPMTLTAVAGAPIGALMEPYVPHSALMLGFAAMVVIAAGRMIWTSVFAKNAANDGQLAPLRTRMIVGVFTGLGIGFVAGLLGIGGGFIVAPLLMALGYPVKTAAGTTAMVAAFSSISGFSAHALQGHFPLEIVLIGGAAVLVGALAGSQFMASHAKPKWIKLTYALVLLVVSVKLVGEVL